MKTIFLIRHGETDWNVQERFQGHIDIPLNERGREQAHDLIKVMSEHAIEAVLSSDLSRALETAKIIADGLNLATFQDAGLREGFLGAAQSLTRAEVEKQFAPSTIQAWRSALASDADVAYPGGETGNQVATRAFHALKGFLCAQPYSKLAVVTHGGVIRRVVESLSKPNTPKLAIPNSMVYKLQFDPQAQIFYL